MKTTQEDVDTMVVEQVAEVRQLKCLRVVVDDSDIFVQLLHSCRRGGIPISTCIDGFANS